LSLLAAAAIALPGCCAMKHRAQGLTILPAVPHQCFVSLAVITPRSLLHLQHPPLYSQRLGVASTD
jgi:hypothetical protein